MPRRDNTSRRYDVALQNRVATLLLVEPSNIAITNRLRISFNTVKKYRRYT